MAYDLKYDKLLRAVEYGEQSEAISYFERKLYGVNEAIHYLFEDGKRFTVTPLYWAVRHNCPKVCKYLLNKGARPYGTVVYEYYPLHEACNRGYDRVVQEFVNARCEVDKMNRDSDTPLHIACMRGHIQCVHILLRVGSDCSLRNKLGHTPLQCAVYHDRNDLVELFKAHNKGIENTAPRNSAHQKHTAVATLSASTGVKVQRSQSFNAPDCCSTSAGPHKRTAHSRVRSSPRPQSYYENDKSTPAALVVGHQPLSFTQSHSRSLQSLSGNASSLQSSFSTISTHVQYGGSSPDSPVEKDAPKRQNEQSRSVSVHQNASESTLPQPYSKSTDDFGTKHGGFTQSGTRKPAESGEVTSAHSPPCPFPSPGGLQKELPERRSSLTQLSHPLLASTRSDVHRNADKLLHERMSHPEFHIAKRDVPITNRAKSSNDVFFSTSTKRESRERVPVFSPSRERINSLATVLCDTLEPDSHTQCHPSLQTSPSLHPLLRGVRASLGTLAHHFGLTPDHQKCLSDLVLTPPPSSLPQSSFSSLDSSLSSLQSLQEVEYEIIEGPLKMNVWRDDGGKEVYVTMVFKVQLCDALVQLRSHMNKGDIALLKVQVRLVPSTADPSRTISVGQVCDLLPEASLLQDLPQHPNIISVLYHCRGRTEKFRHHLMQQVQSEFHAAMGGVSQSHSNSTTESRSGTAECVRGMEDGGMTHSPASTGSFLFQSLPGVSLGKYFHDFLRTEHKEATLEDKCLHILAQLLLAVAHLQKNLVAHCAISPHNVYVSDKGQRVVLGDFGQALNLRPKNLDVLQKSIRRLKASGTRKLSPEAEKSISSTNTDGTTTTHAVNDLEGAFHTSDSYAVGALFYDLLGKGHPLSETETPFIHSLSFRCNHLLQKLVAPKPSDRFSALQGAVSCFVLLFGPRTSEIGSSTECLRWLVSESLELYLNPVLRDSSLPSNRDNSSTRRLHYTYLISANPDLVYNSCKFFNND